MPGRILDTMVTREFLTLLVGGRFDDGRTAAVVCTNYPELALAVRSELASHGLESSALVLEFNDVTDPKRPSAFTSEMAAQVYAFLQGRDDASYDFLFACDGSRSRSAAMMCAWTRLRGGDDLPFWTNAKHYTPNVLVYSLLLAQGGVVLTAEQQVARERLKERALMCKIAGEAMDLSEAREMVRSEFDEGLQSNGGVTTF